MDSARGAVGEDATFARIERLFAMLKRFRAELSPHDDERVLFQRACRIAVELGEFRFAWVGVVDRARGVVVPIGHAGLGAAYLDGLEIAITDSPTGRGPTGTAVREHRPVVCADMARDTSVAPWRDRSLRAGFRSSGAFPFFRGGEVYGTLNLYADAVGFVEAIEQTMMEELSVELGMALDAIDREAARRTMEVRLLESEERYRTIVERAADGVLMFSGERTVRDANPAFCRMFGYAREELLGTSLDDLIAPEKRDAYREDIAHFHRSASGSTLSFERTGLTRDGRRIDLEIHSTLLSHGAAISVVRDVTDRKRNEAERAATERLISLGRLAQSVGHEINNPLSYLTLRLEQARALVQPLDPDLRTELDEALASVADGAARITYVVRALSAFGRGDLEAVEPIAVRSVVDAALSLVSNRLHHLASVEVQLGETPSVQVNAFGLTQVLVNLLLNAADAIESTPRDRHVVAIASHVGAEGKVVVEVSDTGPGIPAADLSRLFDVGFTTKPVGRGTGLGLAIVRSIVTSFAGTVEAVTRASGGATFRIVLPPAEASVSQPSEPPAKALRARRRILVVDDEPLVARTLALLLSGHDVTVCTTIAEAFDICAREDVDVILCDLMMPNGGGMELHERLGREMAGVREKMVFMTGGTFTDATTSFLKNVPNPRLMKPFAIEELLAVVEAAGEGGAA